MALRPYYWLYGWALVPSLALAVESALHLESADSFVSLLVQWGLGALVCVGWEEAKRAIESYLALPRLPAGWLPAEVKP